MFFKKVEHKNTCFADHTVTYKWFAKQRSKRWWARHNNCGKA